MTPLAKHSEAPPLPTYLLVEKEGVGAMAIFLWGEQAGHPKPEELGPGRSRAEAQGLCRSMYEVLGIR